MSESLHADAGQRGYRILRDPELGLGPGPVALRREKGEAAGSSAARLTALADVLAAQSDGALRRTLIRSCIADAGFDWLCYCRVMCLDARVSRAAWYAQYSPPGWAETYCSAQCFDADMRIAKACTTVGWPFAWVLDDLKRDEAAGVRHAGAARALAALAARAGIGSGLTVGFETARPFEYCIVTLSSTLATRAWISDATMGAALVLAGEVHAFVEPRIGPLLTTTGADGLPGLQKRMLDLMTQGLSDREIGELLSLSADQVAYQLGGIERRFGTRNRAQLAYVAGVLSRQPALSAAEPAMESADDDGHRVRYA